MTIPRSDPCCRTGGPSGSPTVAWGELANPSMDPQSPRRWGSLLTPTRRSPLAGEPSRRLERVRPQAGSYGRNNGSMSNAPAYGALAFPHEKACSTQKISVAPMVTKNGFRKRPGSDSVDRSIRMPWPGRTVDGLLVGVPGGVPYQRQRDTQSDKGGDYSHGDGGNDQKRPDDHGRFVA